MQHDSYDDLGPSSLPIDDGAYIYSENPHKTHIFSLSNDVK